MRLLLLPALVSCLGGCHQIPSQVDSLPTLEGEKIELACREDAACPEAVGLVVAPHLIAQTMRCTAALVGADRVLTAGHCVDIEAMNAPIWVAFPKTARHPQEWVASTEVLARSASQRPGLLQSDYAVLRLSRRLSRAPLSMFASPPAPGDIVRMVAVTPDRFYEHKHHVAVRRCRVEDPRRAQPAFGSSVFSVGWLSKCPIHEGNSGAPLLDIEGRLRGLVHGATPPFFAVGVMTNLDFTP